MNNLSDDDPQLTNFLRQYRPLAQPESSNLEARLMSKIDLLPTKTRPQIMRRIVGGMCVIATGILGVTIHHVMQPPELSVAELYQLDRYLIYHSPSFVVEPVASDRADDLDAFLLQDDDPENL